MLTSLRSDLTACPSASSSVAVRPSKLDRSHPLVTCPSASAVPMFPASLPSYLLLPPPPARLPLSRPHCCRRPCCPVLSVPLGLTPSVAVVHDKRDNKSEKKKRSVGQCKIWAWKQALLGDEGRPDPVRYPDVIKALKSESDPSRRQQILARHKTRIFGSSRGTVQTQVASQ